MGTSKDITVVLLVFFIFIMPALAQENASDKSDFPILKGPYLGQRPPGMKAEIFAPGIISITGQEYRESDICFWSDGNRCIFARFGEGIPEFRIFESRVVDGVWTKPEIAGMLQEGGYLPCISPDGRKIVYTPVESARSWPTHLYLKQEVGGEWSPPTRIGEGMYPSMTLESTLYYAYGDDVPIFRRYVDGVYQEEELVGKHIYQSYVTPHPFIAPDESYLLYGDGELYVSFRIGANTWTVPKCMTDYLGVKPAGKPRVSYDGKYIFFVSNNDIYWVDAKIIEELKP